MWAGRRCATAPDGAGNSWSGIDSLCWEATAKDYGVAVAMPQGSSRMPNSSTEQQGTWEPLVSVPRARPARPERVDRRDACRRHGRDGAAVVLGAGESPARGEGRQRASQVEE